MNATITFSTREQAENFARAWTRKTLMGNTIGSGENNVQVNVYNVTDELKEWINQYVSNANNQ